MQKLLKNTLFFFLLTFVLSSCVETKKVEKKDTKLIQLGGVFHKVKDGESLWAISNAYKVPLEDIIEINDFNPNSILYPNDEIFIPNVKKSINKVIVSQTVSNVEINNKFKYRKAKSKKKVAIKKKKENLILGQKYKNSLVWPVNGIIITEFGRNGKFKSDGLDIAAPLNTEIYSVMDGTVVYSGSQSGYGNIIIIKHENKIITIYAHNNKNLIKKGQKVKKGQIIGTIGNTGNAQRYQLHFELRKGVKAINPNPYLKKE